jgi:DNA repair protein RecO (recombination protein O)
VDRIESEALLLRSVALGESDVVATYLTERMGMISVAVRGGRASKKRVQGALEPFHSIALTFLDRGPQAELGTFKEGRVSRLRPSLTGSLAALELCGRLLRWVRALCAPRTPEPEVFALMTCLFDTVDERLLRAPVETAAAWLDYLIAHTGMLLLRHLGYALELGRCVRCGQLRPVGRSGYVVIAEGGLLCSACGGHGRLTTGAILDLGAKISEYAGTEKTTAETLAGPAQTAASALMRLVADALDYHANSREGARGRAHR